MVVNRMVMYAWHITISGAKLWTGKDVDVNGTYDRIREHAHKSTNKRLVFQTEHPINLGKWMDSKLFGILLSMTGTSSDVSRTTVGVAIHHVDTKIPKR